MSPHRRNYGFMAAASFVIGLAVFNLPKQEAYAMGDSSVQSVQMGWQWRAERSLEQRVGIRLIQIKSEGGGLFGIGRSPSLSGSLPDARRVQADVLTIDRPGKVGVAARIEFRIPKLELRGAEEGALAAIGIIGQNVVCFTPAPDEVTEATLPAWLPQAPCP
jgi:hypothetical protein